MKRVLYGTTALLAAGLIAGPALAGAPLEAGNFDLVLDGEIQVDSKVLHPLPGVNPGLNYNKATFVVEYTFDIEGSAAFDNGWEGGFEIQIELDTPGEQVETDQAFLWLTGSFGEINLGGVDAVEHDGGFPRTYDGVGLFGYDKCAAAPCDVNDALHNSGASIEDDIEIGGDDNKVIWEVPVPFSGWELAINYSPNPGSYEKDSQADTSQDMKHNVLVAAQYKAEAGGAEYTVQLAHGRTEVAPDELEIGDKDLDPRTAYRVGLQFELSGWEVGGYWQSDMRDFHDTTPTEDETNWGFGATYVIDKYEFGVGYEKGSREQYTEADANTKDGDDTATRVDLGVKYTLNDTMDIIGGWRNEKYETWDNNAGSANTPGEQEGDSIDLWLEWSPATGLGIDFGYQHFRYDSHYTVDAIGNASTVEEKTANGFTVVTELSF